MKLSAVIPTRGDVPLGAILDHLTSYEEIEEVIIVKGDTPYNRYRAAARAKSDWIYTQDDDCITDIRPLVRFAETTHTLKIVNAMTREHAEQYQGRQTLLGFGCIFHKEMLQSLKDWERDALFFREADRIFATIHEHVTVYPKITILPHAHNENRLWKQGDHCAARDLINQRIFEKTGIRA